MDSVIKHFENETTAADHINVLEAPETNIIIKVWRFGPTE